ncbi:MAG TPA: adenylate/guanylate cyclase domain-containing protein [Terriglobales bacterium]|jgi:adenylate cyclase|nr:adenylate/guanylate cyclase domain-containing protein [Terriglobales bacterium]
MAYLDRTRRVFLRGAILAAAGTALLVIVLNQVGAFGWLEDDAYDARMSLSAKPNTGDPDIVILDVDDPSFDAFKQNFGRWPPSRIVWSETVKYLSHGKPRAMVFDVMFSGPDSAFEKKDENQHTTMTVSGEEVDRQFAENMKAAGNVVIGFTISAPGKGKNDSADYTRVLKQWDLLDADSLPATEGRGLSISAKDHPLDYLLNIPFEPLASAAAGLGSTNADLDDDGKIRHVHLESVVGSHAYDSLSLRTVRLIEKHDDSTRWVAGGFKLNSNSPTIRLGADDGLLLRWHGNRKAGICLQEKCDPGKFPYERIPYWNIVCSISPSWCNDKVNKYAPEYFHDKIVIIGASAVGSYENHPTPLADAVPGFVMHATAIDNLLHADTIRPAPSWLSPILIMLMAATGVVILVFVRSTSADVAVALAVIALYVAISYIFFAHWNFWLPTAAPLITLVISYFSAGVVRFATTGRELRRTRGTLDRYISPQLVGYVLNHLEEINLAGEKRELTIFFSDIRSFTTMTEKSDPTELLVLLNEYLTAMTEIIFKHDGIVDKFIGDGILAYWGAFTPGKNHALLAAKASLEMMRRLEELNQKWKAEGRQPISIGIGLNTGDVIFGNVGSGKKVEFTVIGDPVNLASRLEGLNKEFGTNIIISEQTRERLGDAAIVRPLGGVKVKGKTVETQVYELQWLDATAPQPLAKQDPVRLSSG